MPPASTATPVSPGNPDRALTTGLRIGRTIYADFRFERRPVPLPKTAAIELCGPPTARSECGVTASGAVDVGVSIGHRRAYADRVNQTAMSQPENASVGADPRTATEMLELDRAECLRLLTEGTLGRIAVNVPHRPQPMIRPVNYVFDKPSQSVLIRSGSGSKLSALLRTVRAAFEIDGIDPVGRVGWSVIIQGVTEEITDPAELRRIGALGLEPWAPGHKDHWIRIRANTVSGRRIASDRMPGHQA